MNDSKQLPKTRIIKVKRKKKRVIRNAPRQASQTHDDAAKGKNVQLIPQPGAANPSTIGQNSTH